MVYLLKVYAPCQAVQLLVSQEELGSMELVT
jgi:hypothetical protein